MIPGIDVSHWQDDKSTPQKMNFVKAQAMGAKFVFIKVSERGGMDEDFFYNWKNAKAAGILPRRVSLSQVGHFSPTAGAHFLRSPERRSRRTSPGLRFRSSPEGWKISLKFDACSIPRGSREPYPEKSP